LFSKDRRGKSEFQRSKASQVNFDGHSWDNTTRVGKRNMFASHPRLSPLKRAISIWRTKKYAILNASLLQTLKMRMGHGISIGPGQAILRNGISAKIGGNQIGS